MNKLFLGNILTLWSFTSSGGISRTDVLLMDILISPSGLFRSGPVCSCLPRRLAVLGERQRVGATHTISVLRDLSEEDRVDVCVTVKALAGSGQGLGEEADLGMETEASVEEAGLVCATNLLE